MTHDTHSWSITEDNLYYYITYTRNILGESFVSIYKSSKSNQGTTIAWALDYAAKEAHQRAREWMLDKAKTKEIDRLLKVWGN